MMPATPSGCLSMRARPGSRCSGVDTALAPHPALQLRLGVCDFGGDDVELRKPGLVLRAVAEIEVDRSREPCFVGGDQRLQAGKAILARCVIWIALA